MRKGLKLEMDLKFMVWSKKLLININQFTLGPQGTKFIIMSEIYRTKLTAKFQKSLTAQTTQQHKR